MDVGREPAREREDQVAVLPLGELLPRRDPDGEPLHRREDLPPLERHGVDLEAARLAPDRERTLPRDETARAVPRVGPAPERIHRPGEVFEWIAEVAHLPVEDGADLAVFEALLGPVSTRLGTGPNALPATLGPARFELGIITGDWSWNPLASWLIPGPDDGRVSITSARLEEEADFRVVPESHTFIMNDPEVAKQAIAFFRTGRVLHERGAPVGERAAPGR